MKFLALLLLLLATNYASKAGDSLFIKVHFLYGSKPLRQYKASEPKWFGGMLGGHVGIESDSNQVLNFIPHGRFHVFAKKREPHSIYMEHSIRSFYKILSDQADSVKSAVVYIPVTTQQKHILDSLSNAYLKTTPYDYALFGMRCGAATYEILGQLHLLPAYSYSKTWRKILYPRKLRKRLFKQAATQGWNITYTTGSFKRKWEKD